MNAQTSKKGTFIIPLIIGVLIAGALAWYFWPQLQQKSAEVPPSITISSSKFQGLISGGDVCKIPGIYAFTDAQVSNYIKPGADADANWSTLEQGVHIYHSGESLMVQEIINAIVPTTGNKIMIAYYPADKGNVEKKFVTYPGIAGQEAIEKPEAYTIPEDQGFVIFSCQDTKIWKIRTEKKGAGGVTSVLGTKEAGWILMPAVVNEGIVEDGFLAVHKNKIKSAWFQKGPGFDFQKVEDMNNAKLIGDWKMIWLKIGPVEQQADPAAIPQTINITKQEGLNKQVVIEWTDSAQGNDMNGYAIFRSITPNMDIKFPESYEMVNANPPGNLVGGVEANKKKIFTDDISLIDNTTYYYVIKSIKLEGDEIKVLGTSAEFIVKTLPAGEIPNTIEMITATGGNKQVTVTWKDIAQKQDNIAGYFILRSTEPNIDTPCAKECSYNGNWDFSYLVGVIPVNDSKTFTDKSLKDNTKYYYIIESRDSNKNILGTSVEFNVTTLPADAQAAAAIPPTITITKQEGGNKQVVIEWEDDAQGNAIVGYMIFRSITPNMDIKFPESYKEVGFGSPGNLAGSVAVDKAKTFTDKLSLQDDTTYYYVIKSIKVEGNEFKVVETSKEFSVTTCGAFNNPCPLPPLQ